MLPKTAGSAQTHKSMSFIWIVWSPLYVYLCLKFKSLCDSSQLKSLVHVRTTLTLALHTWPNYFLELQYRGACCFKCHKMGWFSSSICGFLVLPTCFKWAGDPDPLFTSSPYRRRIATTLYSSLEWVNYVGCLNEDFLSAIQNHAMWNGSFQLSVAYLGY